MNVWAIVPVKPLSRAKSRLGDVMTPDDREELATRLLKRTMRLLLSLSSIQGVLVISRDSRALAMVRDLGAQTVQESGTPELNNALMRATHILKAWGANASIIVPADIPLLKRDDIEAVLNLGRYQNSVVLVPDRHEQGTNLMLMRPPGLIPYAYGEHSFNAHQQLAHQFGASVQIYHSERVGLDLDTADDLRAYVALAQRLDMSVIEPVASVERLATRETHAEP